MTETKLPRTTHEADEVIWEVHDMLRRLVTSGEVDGMGLIRETLNAAAERLTESRWRPVLPEPTTEEWSQALYEEIKPHAAQPWPLLYGMERRAQVERFVKVRDRAQHLANGRERADVS